MIIINTYFSIKFEHLKCILFRFCFGFLSVGLCINLFLLVSTCPCVGVCVYILYSHMFYTHTYISNVMYILHQYTVLLFLVCCIFRERNYMSWWSSS